MNYYLTGDCHGQIDRLINFATRLESNQENPSNTAVIILGDTGLNYYGDSSDIKRKKKLQLLDITFYLVRGNHEMRPERLADIQKVYDEEVENFVYIEPQLNHIKYLIDGNCYQIGQSRALVLGGAYSVDKYYRLMRGQVSPNASYEEKARIGWFEDEQLTELERNDIYCKWQGKTVDIILSHTCPISIEPTDLFLASVNQSTVDKSMEKFLEKIKQDVNWSYWFFGHYHQDRIEAPFMEMFYTDITALDDILKYWDEYKITGELPWYLIKSPNFYMHSQN